MDNSSPKIYTEFLPISRADMEARGWEQLDFVVVGGDAYVDHPSFGTAIISRLLRLALLFFVTFPHLNNWTIALCYPATLLTTSVLFVIYYKCFRWMPEIKQA